MAVRTISTKLVVDGEAEYKQAITACNAQLSLLKSGLAATTSEFRNNANSLAALTAKDEKLNELKTAQAEKVQKLKDALENCRRAVEQYAQQHETLQSKVQASDQAVAALDVSTQKAGKRWAEYAQEVEKGERALETLRRSSGDTSAEQAKLEASISKARDEMGKLETATDGAAKEAGELILENQKLHSAFSDNNASLEAATRGANNWEKQLNSAQIEANKLDDELEKNSQYLDEAKNSANGCATSIDQYGKAAKEAGDDTDTLADKLKSGLVTGAKAAATAIAAVGTAAAAGVKLLNDVAASTEEYRIAQGKLNTAFEAAGYSTETAREAYQTLYSILGDTDNATESAQLLAQLARSEEDVAAWGEIAAGVTGTFGDALPINSLIEASNETAKVGKVTGALADALNWVGISEDEFNEKLAACGDETERTNLVTKTLSETYQNASGIFRENNAALLEANKAQAELDETMARLGGTVAEIKTALTAEFAPALAEAADAFISLAGGAEGAEEELAAAIGSLTGKAAEKLPELMEFGTEIILNLLGGITGAAPQLAEGAVTLITSLTEGLLEALPQLAEAASQLIAGLAEGVAGAAPELIPAGAEAVAQLVQAVVDNVPLLAEAALDLITGLSEGVLEAVPALLEAVPELIESLVDALLDAVPEITETGVELLTALVEDLPEIVDTIVEVLPEIIDSVVTTLLDHLPELVEAGIELLTALVEDLPEIIRTVTGALPEIVSSIAETLLDHIPEIVETGVGLLTSLIEDLPHIIAEIVMALPEIVTGMVDTLGEGVSRFEDVGKDLVRGLWTGIQSLAGWLWNKVSSWIQSIWDGITDFFGIASPSRQMAWVGEMLVEGLAGAVDANGKKAVRAVGRLSSDMLSAVEAETGRIGGALADSTAGAVQGAVRDMEDSFAAQKALLSRMEAEFRSTADGASTALRQFAGEAGWGAGYSADIQALGRAAQDAAQQRGLLEAACAQSAQAALYSMERHLPSAILEPRTVTAEEQTAAILSAIGGQEGGVVNHFHIGEMNVRSDADLDYIVQRLYDMQRRERRSRGGGVL